ncbi:MAG: DNA repair protein RadC [Lysobacteraceae bacterium]
MTIPADTALPATTRSTSIKHLPEDERPREKLMARGTAALSDAELLALFLGSGLRGRNAIELSRDLLVRHGGLRGLMAMPCSALMQLPGLGPARATRLAAALELSSRYLVAQMQRENIVADTARADRYFRIRLRDRPAEVFACLFLDIHHRPIAVEELFFGTLDCAEVHPREVVRRCIHHNAAAVIVAHNHPSGDAEPSHADRAITAKLCDALKLVGVRVVDHIVVGSNQSSSFAQRGWL